MSGFGSGGWGSSLFGAGLHAGPLTVSSAQVLHTPTVWAILSRPPLAISAIGVGDALNPRTWIVDRLDSLGAVEKHYTVLAVEQLDANAFSILVLQKFGAHALTHRVGSLTMLDTTGSLIVAPYYGNFRGVAVRKVSNELSTTADLLNLDDGVGGLSVGADGDYRKHSGASLLWKLIMRRLASQPGSWFQYSEEYGLGITVKGLIRPSDIGKIQTGIEKQLLADPDVVSGTVGVSTQGSILRVDLRVKIRRTGETFDASVSTPSGTVVF